MNADTLKRLRELQSNAEDAEENPVMPIIRTYRNVLAEHAGDLFGAAEREPALVAALREFNLPEYTDEQLSRLAASTTGMGEISPAAARRQIKLRTALAAHPEENTNNKI